MRRASRGRFEVPGSRSEVDGKEACMTGWAGGWPVGLVGALAVWGGCAEGWVGGLGCGAVAVVVAGGVEMPFCNSAGAGDAIEGGLMQRVRT